LCKGYNTNGIRLDRGLSKGDNGRPEPEKKPKRSPRTKERQYLRCVAAEVAVNPERPEGVRGKKLRKKRRPPGKKGFPSTMELSAASAGN